MGFIQRVALRYLKVPFEHLKWRRQEKPQKFFSKLNFIKFHQMVQIKARELPINHLDIQLPKAFRIFRLPFNWSNK